MRLPSLIPLVVVSACASPNTVEVTLAPAVISSIDGRTTVSAIAASDTTPLSDVAVHMTIDYTDRNGTPHMISPVDGHTDSRGVFSSTIEGLTWDGTGKVTVRYSDTVLGEATFAVLDRTPPKVEILPPTTDLHVGPGLPLDVQVHVSDEIGVSQVLIDASGGLGGGGGGRSTALLSGTQDTKVTFRMNVPAGAMAGATFNVFALVTDLSGNSAAAVPITLTVDPAIVIATPPGLTGGVLAAGTAQQLVNPRAIVASPKDGHLYVADNAGTTGCTPSCIWRVDPTTGAIDAAPVYVGTGVTEGVAVDATGDNMYISDSTNRVVRLTYNGGYGTPTACDDVTQQHPQDPVHLVFDATLGILVVDSNRKEVTRIATCAATTAGTTFSMAGSFDAPRGIALGPGGEIYVSDQNRDQILRVDRSTGAVSGYANNLNGPYGMEWLTGGPSAFADSLMVASSDRTVESIKSNGVVAAAYLRDTPIDLTFAAGTMMVVTSPAGNNRARIYRVSGF